MRTMDNGQMTMSNGQMTMSKPNPAYEKSYALAIRIVHIYKQLTEQKREFVLSRQLLKSGTSIGANLAEAKGAISEADLSAKVSIAYKEAQETKYWLNLLKDTGYLDAKSFESIFPCVDEVAAILFAILKKTRISKTMNSKQLTMDKPKRAHESARAREVFIDH